LRLDELSAVLQKGGVFRRLDIDADAAHRRAVLRQLAHAGDSVAVELGDFLQQARDDGHDWLLVVELLQDGPVDAQGVNGRWPITLATWLLLGVGALIPDHTFESRATLRVTVRDLQTGRVVDDLSLSAGPVDLSLIERSNFLGIVLSLLVPPFWVHDDATNVQAGVREVTRRRLLVSLARDLKSEPVRSRLRESSKATVTFEWRAGRLWLVVVASESVASVRLRQAGGAIDEPAAAELQQRLLASRQPDGGRWRYEAAVDLPLAPGLVQVLVLTIAGTVASTTLLPEVPP